MSTKLQTLPTPPTSPKLSKKEFRRFHNFIIEVIKEYPLYNQVKYYNRLYQQYKLVYKHSL